MDTVDDLVGRLRAANVAGELVDKVDEMEKALQVALSTVVARDHLISTLQGSLQTATDTFLNVSAHYNEMIGDAHRTQMALTSVIRHQTEEQDRHWLISSMTVQAALRQYHEMSPAQKQVVRTGLGDEAMEPLAPAPRSPLGQASGQSVGLRPGLGSPAPGTHTA